MRHQDDLSCYGVRYDRTALGAAVCAGAVLFLLILVLATQSGGNMMLMRSGRAFKGPGGLDSTQLSQLVDTVASLKDDFDARHHVSYDPDYNRFLVKLKRALDTHQLKQRVLNEVFSDADDGLPRPACGGTWLEFGVHTAGTIRHAARWRAVHCTNSTTPISGFDTFSGLPEQWGAFEAGAFDLEGSLPEVPSNVRLVAGLFNESLPKFLADHDAEAGGKMAEITYLHVDCDLYAGANDVLTLLDNRLAHRAIIMFDELVNYPLYRDHEAKAMWEWLGRSGRTLEVIGIWGPLPNRADAVELHPQADLGGLRSSAGFVVL